MLLAGNMGWNCGDLACTCCHSNQHKTLRKTIMAFLPSRAALTASSCTPLKASKPAQHSTAQRSMSQHGRLSRILKTQLLRFDVLLCVRQALQLTKHCLAELLHVYHLRPSTNQVVRVPCSKSPAAAHQTPP
jgi:hypothetical protein